MLQRVKEVQESDLRMVGALARNIQRVLAVTQADIDAAAAQGKGWLVKRVVKVNDPLDNLRGGTQLVIKQNSIQPGQNVMRVLYSGNSKTVGPAVAPLSLPGAAADDIIALIAFGGTQQEGVPQEYTRLDRLQGDGNAYIDLGITLNQDDEIEVDFIFKYASGSQMFGYRDSASSKNITLFSGGGAGSIYMDFNNSDYSNYRLGTSGTDDAQYTAKISKTKRGLYSGTTEIVANNTACPDTFTTGNALLFFAGGSPSGTAKFTGSILGVRIKDRMNLVPAKRNSDDVLGMYDTITGQFFTNAAGSGAFIAGDPMAPTPAYPADILCNNGVLIFTPNLLDMATENIVLGKYINNSGVISDSGPNFYNSKYIPVVAGGTYTWSTSSSISYFSVMEYGSDYAFKKRTLFSNAGTSGSITLRSDTAFVLIGSNMDSTDVTLDKIAAIDWQFELGSSATSYRPYSENKVYTAGPIETIAIKDDQDATVSTATCKDLLSVGAYTDEQEVISGVVTRKVGVKVFDGTETWYASSTYLGSCYTNVITSATPTGQVICSHFQNASSLSNYSRGKCYKEQTSFNLWYGDNRTTAVADLKQFLADQYAAGTPVIVIYPLATPTTNTVTPQPMQTAVGDNTAEITQAGMAGLELEVEYVEA